MSQFHRVTRRSLGALLIAAAAAATSACSFASLDEAPPGAGANAVVGDVHVLNVVLVGSQGSARLVASVITPTNDTLVSITGAPIKHDGTNGQPFATTRATVPTPAGQLVNLDSRNITVKSPDIAQSVNATLTFTFSDAGPVTLTAPITYTSNPDYAPSNSAA